MMDETYLYKLIVTQGRGNDAQHAMRLSSGSAWVGSANDNGNYLSFLARTLDHYLLDKFGYVARDRRWRVLALPPDPWDSAWMSL